MSFYLKFDLLMNITGTSNIAMSKFVLLDPSYISRLRRGTRNIPENSGYEKTFAKYFVHHCSTSYQKSAFLNAIGVEDKNAFNEPDRLIQYVASWLVLREEAHAGTLTADYNRALFQNQIKTQPQNNESSGEIMTFYGIEGRGEATLALFRKVALRGLPTTLFIYSDESEQWMNGKSTFYFEWDSLLRKIISNGGKVKVIHKTSNNINEMLEIIHRWLPFYVTGAVEPYYYPKLRDGIYKRSLSVALGVGAAFSTSIGQQEDISPTFLTNDPLVENSFVNEFSSYLALCKPLIQFYEPEKCFRELISHEYFTKKTAEIFISDGLSLASMPFSVLKSIKNRYQDNHFADFISVDNAILNQSRITHVMRLANHEDAVRGNVPVNSSFMLSKNTAVHYTPLEYCKHLSNIIRLLEKHSNFEVLFSEGSALGFSLQVFEDSDVFIFKGTTPALRLRISERNTVSAFWVYMLHYCESMTVSLSRKDTINFLKTCIGKVGFSYPYLP